MVSDITINVGLVKRPDGMKIKQLQWKNFNAIIVPGQSGSGKSSTASFILGQMATHGVQLILCDYNGGIDESLVERMEFAKAAFLWKPATDGKAILDYIDKIKAIGDARLQDKNGEHSPIIFVIDEFTNFLASTGKVTKKRKSVDADGTEVTETESEALVKLLGCITAFRKANIRFMFLGHVWVNVFGSSSLRSFRDQCSVSIIHNLSAVDARVFATGDDDVQRAIPRLQKGKSYMYSNGAFTPLLVPYLDPLGREKLGAKITSRFQSVQSVLSEDFKQCVFDEKEDTNEDTDGTDTPDTLLRELLSNAPKRNRLEIIASLIGYGWTRKKFRENGVALSNDDYTKANALHKAGV